MDNFTRVIITVLPKRVQWLQAGSLGIGVQVPRFWDKYGMYISQNLALTPENPKSLKAKNWFAGVDNRCYNRRRGWYTSYTV